MLSSFESLGCRARALLSVQAHAQLHEVLNGVQSTSVFFEKILAAFANSQETCQSYVRAGTFHDVCNRDTLCCRKGVCCISDAFRVMVLNLRQSHVL